jgi:hypothetical protein
MLLERLPSAGTKGEDSAWLPAVTKAWVSVSPSYVCTSLIRETGTPATKDHHRRSKSVPQSKPQRKPRKGAAAAVVAAARRSRTATEAVDLGRRTGALGSRR